MRSDFSGYILHLICILCTQIFLHRKREEKRYNENQKWNVQRKIRTI